MRKLSLRIMPGFFYSLAISLLLVPFPLLGGWIAATVWHEACHYMMLQIFRLKVYAIVADFGGIRMETEHLSGLRLSLCALAGPVGGFLLTFLLPLWPAAALCGGIQSLYNLLPIVPLDGEKIVRGVLCRLFSDEAAMCVMKWIRIVTLLLLLIDGIVCVFRFGRFSLIVVAAFFLKIIPCKCHRLEVQ